MIEYLFCYYIGTSVFMQLPTPTGIPFIVNMEHVAAIGENDTGGAMLIYEDNIIEPADTTVDDVLKCAAGAQVNEVRLSPSKAG